MIRLVSAIVLVASLLSCGGGTPAQRNTRKPEQRVEMALSSKDISVVEGNLKLIPERTPGRNKVVAHLASLRDAQAKADVEERESRARAAKVALAKLRKETDNVKNITFYYDLNTPRHVNSRSEMYVYFAEQMGRPSNLRLVVQYVADDWLFVQQYLVKADSRTFTIAPGSQFAVERDNGGGKIWEWFDTPVGPSEYEMLKALIASKSATLRYEGNQYYKDRQLSLAERQRLANVVVAFEALGGKVE